MKHNPANDVIDFSQVLTKGCEVVSFDWIANLSRYAPEGWGDDFVACLTEQAHELVAEGRSLEEIMREIIFHATGKEARVPVFSSVEDVTCRAIAASRFEERRMAASQDRRRVA